MTTMQGIPTVTMSQAPALMQTYIKAGKPIMIHGGTGIGKTSLVAQVASSMGKNFRVIIPSTKGMADYSGLPVPDLKTKTTTWMRPDFLPREDRDGKDGILAIDEINTAPPATQPVLFGLVLDGVVGEHRIAEGWSRVAMGNRIFDGASALRMSTALRARFGHLNIEPDVESFAKYMTQSDDENASLLTAFLRFRPALLFCMPGCEAQEGDYRVSVDRDAMAFPNPRAWESILPFMGYPSETRQTLIGAAVGTGPASELEGFIPVATSLPSQTEIESNPSTAAVPTDLAAIYAISAACARWATRKNFAQIMTYAARLGAEYETLTMTDATNRDKDLCETEQYGTWQVEKQGIRK